MNEDINDLIVFFKEPFERGKTHKAIDKKDTKLLLNYITNLQKENELHNKILKDANDVLNIQAQKGNYNYDSYMLGLYNGMEMIVSLFEQREPKFKRGKDIKFLHETDYKQRCEKVIEKLGKYKHYTTPTEEQNSENEDIVDSAYNILEGGDE